ncbi:MAG: hypothetical protein HGA85_09125 [Nanoarchaeota archaeon]|nr:hypothetical protein [Nanoarchaeota archaeon]
MVESQVKDIMDLLKELSDDNTVPRNVKTKLDTVSQALGDKTDISLRVNKALSILEEISDDNNIQPYTRTQVWNIISMLESLD